MDCPVDLQNIRDQEVVMARIQVNVRLDTDIAKRIDEKRTQLQKELGRIPTRSDVMRMALDKFLGKDLRKIRS